MSLALTSGSFPTLVPGSPHIIFKYSYFIEIVVKVFCMLLYAYTTLYFIELVENNVEEDS